MEDTRTARNDIEYKWIAWNRWEEDGVVWKTKEYKEITWNRLE